MTTFPCANVPDLEFCHVFIFSGFSAVASEMLGLPISHLEGVHTENSNRGVGSSVGAGGIYTDEVGHCAGGAAEPAFRGCFL